MQKAEKTAQRRKEEAEKQVAKLREVDEKRQCEINNLRSLVSKKEEEATKLEKRIAKALEESAASEEALRVALRKAQAERDATSKKKSAKIENLQKVNSELKKTINEINTSRENDQALNAAVMKSQEEKLVAKMKVEQEDHTANVRIMEGKHEELTIKAEELEKNLQRKCEEIEVLQLIIEEKENMDTTKAGAVDSEHLNAVLDDEEKPVGQEDFVQQLKKTVPKASEPKVSEDDQRVRVVKEMDLKSIGLKDSNESLEPETELWRGSDEQPVRQEDFVQQPAKQEAVSRDSDPSTITEFMKKMTTIELMIDSFSHKRSKAKKKNCSDGPSDDDSS